MNGGERGSEKKYKTKIAFNVKSQHNSQPLFSWIIIFYVIDFFLIHAHPKFVYKLDINNYQTALHNKIWITFSTSL